MKSKIAVVFMVLAGLGFFLSLVLHIASILKIALFTKEPWFLHIGIFVVWFPTIIYSQSLVKEFPQIQMWRAALRGCPKPMQYILYGLFAYAILNFLIFASNTPNESSPTATIRGFSGHWLAFYYTAFAILYSYIQVQKQDPVRRCHNGHAVIFAAKYCSECGTYVGDILANKS